MNKFSFLMLFGCTCLFAPSDIDTSNAVPPLSDVMAGRAYLAAQFRELIQIGTLAPDDERVLSLQRNIDAYLPIYAASGPRFEERSELVWVGKEGSMVTQVATSPHDGPFIESLQNKWVYWPKAIIDGTTEVFLTQDQTRIAGMRLTDMGHHEFFGEYLLRRTNFIVPKTTRNALLLTILNEVKDDKPRFHKDSEAFRHFFDGVEDPHWETEPVALHVYQVSQPLADLAHRISGLLAELED